MVKKITGGKVYQAITHSAIIGIFIAIALLVFGIMGFLPLGKYVVGAIISVVVLCLSLISTLPWVKRLEEGKMKKLSTMFLVFIGVCAVLWLICVWMTIIISSKPDATEAEISTLLVLIKIVVIASAQLMISSYVGNLIIRFNKSLIVFQIITVLSCLFIDFYVVYLFACIQVLPEIHVADGISLLGNKLMITLLILSVIFVAVANVIIRVADTKRMRVASETIFSNEPQSQPAEETVNDKLQKAKNLFDQGLITEEEYEQKRKELLKDL